MGRAPEQQRPRIEPPITRAFLSKVDITRIIKKPKLRHDMIYDPEVHVYRILDSENARRKQDKAQQFWVNLHNELTQFVDDRDEFLKTHGPDDNEWSLPALLNAVKDIIPTLAPACDRGLLNESLDVPFIMQQFAHGVLDVEKLASWLSSVLKLHCFPMRDNWVDKMCNELSRGNRENDVGELVKGMCSLLSVLEAMKLDVANHQIRCLRPLLIENTVHFEQRYFYKMIQNRRMSVTAARNWYQQAKTDFASATFPHRQSFGDMAVFFYGLVDLLLSSVDAGQVPNTFVLDIDRIVWLQSNMFHAIYLEICMKVYETAEREEITMTNRVRRAYELARDSVPVDPRTLLSYVIPPFILTLSGDTWATRLPPADDFDLNTPPESTASDSPASSRPSSLAFSTCGSATSSPQTVCADLDADGAGAPPQQPEAFANTCQRSAVLYWRLVALLESAPATLLFSPSECWKYLQPLIAVEIKRALSSVERACRFPLDEIETRLRHAMQPNADIKEKAEIAFRERLLSALARRVNVFKTMPNVGLFAVDAAAMAPCNWPTDSPEDKHVGWMATLLAYLGTMHWRVWATLVYEPGVPFGAPTPPM